MEGLADVLPEAFKAPESVATMVPRKYSTDTE